VGTPGEGFGALSTKGKGDRERTRARLMWGLDRKHGSSRRQSDQTDLGFHGCQTLENVEVRGGERYREASGRGRWRARGRRPGMCRFTCMYAGDGKLGGRVVECRERFDGDDASCSR